MEEQKFTRLIRDKILILIVLALAGLAVFVFADKFFLAAISSSAVDVKEFACVTDSECGTNTLTGSSFCQNNTIYQNFITYTCNNPGTAFSSCINSTEAQLQIACADNQTCSNGSCLTTTSGGGSGGYVRYYPTVLTPTTPILNVPQPEKLIENPIIQPQNIPEVSACQLPLAIANLSAKIPEFAKVLFNLDINCAEDIANLQNYNIFLPGSKKITGASEIDFPNLLPAQKDALPTDLVFVLLGNGNIDALTSVDFTENAPVLEKINVPVKKPLRLMVKPSLPTETVSGYVLFDADGVSKLPQNFSVLKFNYTDTDNDGIFTADIYAPTVEGRYQIVTSINYGADSKEIRTTTLVDPDGYIYEQLGDKELRINNAIVSLHQMNNKNEYELWRAEEYGQENPQITNKTGDYSFLVPEGTYYLTVTAIGYNSYRSDAISVKEGKEFHSNIALKKQTDAFSFLDWNTVLIIILFCFVGYNFYLDRRRKLS